MREDVLAKRIARAHGWARTGKKIKDRVLALALNEYPETEEDVGRFFWPLGSDTGEWGVFRCSENGNRPVDEISMQELIVLARETVAKGPNGNDAVIAMMRKVGLQRLGNDSRVRLELALEVVAIPAE